MNILLWRIIFKLKAILKSDMFRMYNTTLSTSSFVFDLQYYLLVKCEVGKVFSCLMLHLTQIMTRMCSWHCHLTWPKDCRSFGVTVKGCGFFLSMLLRFEVKIRRWLDLKEIWLLFLLLLPAIVISFEFRHLTFPPSSCRGVEIHSFRSHNWSGITSFGFESTPT